MSHRFIVAAALAVALSSGAGCESSSGSGSDATVAADPAAQSGAVTCDDYCTAIQKVCTGTHAQFADAAACQAKCKTYAQGKKGDTGGDSLSCRRFHLGEVEESELNADEDCVVAGPTGGAECIPEGGDDL